MLPITNLNGQTELLTGVTALSRKRKVNGEKTLKFIALPTDNNAHSYPFVETQSTIDFQDETYIIKQSNERNWGTKTTKQVDAVHEFFDHMISRFQYDSWSGSQTLNTALSRVFGPTDYSYVIDAFANAASFDNFGQDNCLSLFKTVLDRYGLEFRVVGNIVYLEREIGNDVDFQYRYKHNVKTIDVEIDTKNLATIIKGFGGEPDDDGNYPVEVEYTSPNVSIFGEKHAQAVYDERYTTESGLLERLQNDLVDEPEFSITIDIADLRAAGYNYHTVNEGDSGWVIYEPMKLKIKVRVVEIEEQFKFTDGEWVSAGTNVTLANLRQRASDRATRFENTSKTVERLKRGQEKLPSQVLDEAVINATRAIQSAQTELKFENGILAIDPSNPNLVVAYTSQGFGISQDGGQTFTTAMTGDGVVADVVTAGTMLFDRLQGGTATLGGSGNGFGQLQVLDDDDEVIADLDAERGGFSDLTIDNLLVTGSIDAPDVIMQQAEDITYRVRGTQGSDDNSGVGDWEDALFSAQEAIDRLPKFINGNVTIEFSNLYDITENLTLDGFTGAGTITLDFRGNTFRGYIKTTSCNLRVTIENGEIERQSGDQYLIDNEGSSYLYIADMILNGDGHDYGVRTWRSGHTYVVRTEVYNVDICFYGTSLGRIYVSSSAGLGNEYGVRVINGAIAHAGTSAPDGVTDGASSTDSAQIIGSWTHDSGSATPPAPPVTEVTQTWTATSSGAWRPNFGGQWNAGSRAPSPYQGTWDGFGAYKGLWFFGSGMRDTLQGKTIKRIRVKTSRLGAGGSSASVGVVFRLHSYASRPSGEPLLSNNSHSVGFSWGQTRTFTLPSSFHSMLSSGDWRGIGILAGSSPYAIMSTSCEIEVTYET